jgi:hypothetical protein
LGLRGRKVEETGENCVMENFAIYNPYNQIKEDQMGRACST